MAKKVEAPVKPKNSLANRLKKASGSEYASILSDNEYPIKGYISLGNYMLVMPKHKILQPQSLTPSLLTTKISR